MIVVKKLTSAFILKGSVGGAQRLGIRRQDQPVDDDNDGRLTRSAVAPSGDEPAEIVAPSMGRVCGARGGHQSLRLLMGLSGTGAKFPAGPALDDDVRCCFGWAAAAPVPWASSLGAIAECP